MIVLDISVINWKIFQGPTRIFVVVFGHADAVYAWLHIVPKTSEIVQKKVFLYIDKNAESRQRK